MLPRHKRLIAILSFGSLICSLIVFYIQFFMRRPIGEGPAGPSVAAEAFAKPWSMQSVKLVGIGDSITAGLGAKSPDHTFFNRLLINPQDEFAEMQGKCLSAVLPQLSHENFAISGSTSLEHLAVIEERLPVHPPEVFGLVVMTTGGNDLIHSYGRMPPKECAMYGATLEQATPWIAAYAVRLDHMLTKIEAAFPGGCEVYLADIYDPTDGVGDAPSVYLPHWPDGLVIHAKYNEAIDEASASRPNVHRVPLHKTFLGHGAHCRQFWRPHYDSADPHYWFYDNIEDPNDRGYDAIRRVFLNSIVENTQLRQAHAAGAQLARQPQLLSLSIK
jgi:lysophospholipase L1-like esterase